MIKFHKRKKHVELKKNYQGKNLEWSLTEQTRVKLKRFQPRIEKATHPKNVVNSAHVSSETKKQSKQLEETGGSAPKKGEINCV